jgi:transposase
LVRERAGYDARCGALFLFMGRRRHTLKILFFDGTGLCVFYKLLDKGTFSLPVAPEGATHVEIDDVVLEALLDGIDLSGASKRTKKKAPRVH